MPKAYLIAHIRVQDAEKFEAFKSASAAAIRARVYSVRGASNICRVLPCSTTSPCFITIT